jgi:hypothetical protein
MWSFAVMSPALDFLLNHENVVFPGTPIVFCGIDRRELGGHALPSRVTGVLLKRAFAPTLDIALKLHPRTRRVVFVAGTSEFDSRLLEQAREELLLYKDRLDFTYLTALPMRDLLSQVSELPPHTIVLYSTLFKDGAKGSLLRTTRKSGYLCAINNPMDGIATPHIVRTNYPRVAHKCAFRFVRQPLAQLLVSVYCKFERRASCGGNQIRYCSLSSSNDSVPPDHKYSHRQKDIFLQGNLTATLETKDVEKTWDLGGRRAAFSGAEPVQKDCR